MTPTVCILGSGKMALNIGLFFMRKGYGVSWVSRQGERLEFIEKKAEKESERTIRHGLKATMLAPPSFYLRADRIHNPPNVVIECTSEDLEKKRSTVATVQPFIDSGKTLLVSASSSILPKEIHRACIGCHFFYPVELTACVELIFSSAQKNELRNNVQNFFHQLGFQTVIQEENSAFAANRLLLPLQAEMFRIMAAGKDAQMLDKASAFPWMNVGQFSLIDAIGLDIVSANVDNYVQRMPPEQADDYASLQDGLKKMVADGKLGEKNNNGLLSGKAIALDQVESAAEEIAQLKARFMLLFANTCKSFLNFGLLTEQDLNLLLFSLYKRENLLDTIARILSDSSATSMLAQWHAETGLSYYMPAE